MLLFIFPQSGIFGKLDFLLHQPLFYIFVYGVHTTYFILYNGNFKNKDQAVFPFLIVSLSDEK